MLLPLFSRKLRIQWKVKLYLDIRKSLHFQTPHSKINIFIYFRGIAKANRKYIFKQLVIAHQFLVCKIKLVDFLKCTVKESLRFKLIWANSSILGCVHFLILFSLRIHIDFGLVIPSSHTGGFARNLDNLKPLIHNFI